MRISPCSRGPAQGGARVGVPRILPVAERAHAHGVDAGDLGEGALDLGDEQGPAGRVERGGLGADADRDGPVRRQGGVEAPEEPEPGRHEGVRARGEPVRGPLEQQAHERGRGRAQGGPPQLGHGPLAVERQEVQQVGGELLAEGRGGQQDAPL